MSGLIKGKQIDIASLLTALNVTTTARQAISVAAGSLLQYNTTTGVLDYKGYISSKTIHVDKDNSRATDTRTGVSKYNYDIPFATIQAAINAFSNGDLILVDSNTYTENISLAGTNKIYVIQFNNVTLYGNITLSNDISNVNILQFNNNCIVNGNILINTNSTNCVLLSDGTGIINGYINRLATPLVSILFQGFKIINSGSSVLYSGSSTFRTTPELIFKNIELITTTNANCFSSGNLKFENCYVYQNSENDTDSIFLNGGISNGSRNSIFESKNGKISYSNTTFWFFNIINSTFISKEVSFDILSSTSSNKIGQFSNCFFISNKEVFKYSVNSSGKLLLNNCTFKLVDLSKYIIICISSVTPEIIEANNIVHNSNAGFYDGGSYPLTYTENNLLKLETL